MSDRPPSADADSCGGALRRMTPFRWLLVAVVVYFAVAFSLSWLRAIELQTTTWDLGLYQQALWTTAHGRALYETADVETGGFGSLLDVHTSFVLFLVAPLYGALPYQTTLFALQAAVVALASVPLYFLARDLTGSPRLALVAGLMYLVWTPTLSGNLYDFHPEAFLPLEVFALVLCWNRGRYAAGFAVAALAFATLEIAQGHGHGPVADHLRTLPEVLEAHTITGEADMMVRLVARSNADLQRVIDQVVASDDVVRASTVIVLATEIDMRAMPLVALAGVPD